MQAITKLVTHGRTELAKVIVGQSELIDGTLTALLCGHALDFIHPAMGRPRPIAKTRDFPQSQRCGQAIDQACNNADYVP